MHGTSTRILIMSLPQKTDKIHYSGVKHAGQTFIQRPEVG